MNFHLIIINIEGHQVVSKKKKRNSEESVLKTKFFGYLLMALKMIDSIHNQSFLMLF